MLTLPVLSRIRARLAKMTLLEITNCLSVVSCLSLCCNSVEYRDARRL